MKSAYELAMERLRESQGDLPSLTDEQKERLDAITCEFEAKVAERELAVEPQIAAVLAQGNIEEAMQLKQQLELDIRKLREREEDQKQKVREESSAG